MKPPSAETGPHTSTAWKAGPPETPSSKPLRTSGMSPRNHPHSRSISDVVQAGIRSQCSKQAGKSGPKTRVKTDSNERDQGQKSKPRSRKIESRSHKPISSVSPYRMHSSSTPVSPSPSAPRPNSQPSGNKSTKQFSLEGDLVASSLAIATIGRFSKTEPT